MKFLIVIGLIFCSLPGLATSSIHLSCDLQIFSMGTSDVTPVQKEVESVLFLKGFNVIRRSATEFNSANLNNITMFAKATAGPLDSDEAVDCVVREFKDLGRFYTCRYELTLYTFSLITKAFEPVVEVKAATRDSRSTVGFYQTIQDQLRELPVCLDSVKR